MRKLLRCVVYLACLGFASFIFGRLLPKGIFHADRFPWRSFRFERGGRVYDRLKIRAWQNKVPDMSRVLPKLMPAKRLEQNSPDTLPRMVAETCVAELTHALLGLLGFGCLLFWPGVGGAIVSVLFLLGNLPFIFIQRYNRPRLARLTEKLVKKKQCEP